MPSLTPSARLICRECGRGLGSTAGTSHSHYSLGLLSPLVQPWLLVNAGSSFLLVSVLDPTAHSLSLVTNKAAR